MQLASAALLASGVAYALNQTGNKIGGSISRSITASASTVAGSMPNVASNPLGRFVEPVQQLPNAAERFVDLARRGWPWPFMRPATKKAGGRKRWRRPPPPPACRRG